MLGFLFLNVFKNLLTGSTISLEHLYIYTYIFIYTIKTLETNNNQDPQRKYDLYTRIEIS